MQLNQIILPIRKWWWLLIAATLVAAVSSFFVASLQPPIYRTKTTLLIGRALTDPNPDQNQFALDMQLAQTYAELAKREVVYVGTMNALGLPELPAYDVRVVPNSQLLEISVTDTNPERAMIVANELANQLILNSPTGPRQEDQDRQQFLNQQLTYFETQIQTSRDELDRLERELGTMTSARQIQDTQAQIRALQDKITAMQTTYNDLIRNLSTGAANSISVMVPADLPLYPIGPNKPIIALLAAMGGFALATAAAFLMEFISNTLRTSEEVSKIVNAPIVGYIPEIKAENRGTYAVNFPYSSFAESFRMLRTNLEFTRLDRSLKTVLISSPGPADGKSTVASNLALVMAQANKRVALIGGDLRQPALGELLNLNGKGLSELLSGKAGLDEVIRPFGDPPVAVITSGSIPSNPAELLSSPAINQLLAYLKDHYDIVLIDCPPFFVSDATILASRVDGLLLVVRPDYTRKDALAAVKDQTQRVGVRLFGVVINGVSVNSSHYLAYYGRYGYGSEEEMDLLAMQKVGKLPHPSATETKPVTALPEKLKPNEPKK